MSTIEIVFTALYAVTLPLVAVKEYLARTTGSFKRIPLAYTNMVPNVVWSLLWVAICMAIPLYLGWTILAALLAMYYVGLVAFWRWDVRSGRQHYFTMREMINITRHPLDAYASDLSLTGFIKQ